MNNPENSFIGIQCFELVNKKKTNNNNKHCCPKGPK